MSTKLTLLTSETIQKNVNELLTLKQVAKMFRVSEMTVYTWKRWQKLPFIVIPSDQRPAIRFHPVDVAKWAKREGIAVPTSRSREHFRKMEEMSKPAIQRKSLAA